jgi:hypothetical protein
VPKSVSSVMIGRIRRSSNEREGPIDGVGVQQHEIGVCVRHDFEL